jgi:hypothetical protein
MIKKEKKKKKRNPLISTISFLPSLPLCSLTSFLGNVSPFPFPVGFDVIFEFLVLKSCPSPPVQLFFRTTRTFPHLLY